MANLLYPQLQSFTIYSSGASLGDTTLTLTTFKTIDGIQLTMANFGPKGFITLEPGAGVQEEQISFTGVTANANGTTTLTGVKTVLFLSPYTETSGLAKQHSGGVQCVVAITSGLLNTFANKANDESVTGKWTFTTAQRPTLTADTDTTTDTDLVDYGQLARTSVAGAVDADLTHKGIDEIATAAEIDADTALGATGASIVTRPDQLALSKYGTRLPSADQKSALAGSSGTPSATNKYVTELDQPRNTGSISYATAVGGTGDAITATFSPTITALTTGMELRFKATADNTTAVTFKPDALAATPVKLSPATALTGGEIKTGAMVKLVYDGTNFQMSVVPPVLIAGPGSDARNLHAHGVIASGQNVVANTDGVYSDVLTTTLPAGILSTKHGLKLRAFGTATAAQTGGATPSVGARVVFGGTTFTLAAPCDASATGTSGIWELEFLVFNINSAAAQRAIQRTISVGTGGTPATTALLVPTRFTATENTAGAVAVTFSVVANTGGETASITVDKATLEYVFVP